MCNNKKVLLIIDPQNGFKNKHTEKALEKINNITSYFDICFASLFYNPEKSLYKDLLYWNNFSKHKKEDYFELAINKHRKLKIIKTHKYGKLTWKIRWFLKIKNIKTVYLCGLETDACIYKTALDLFDAGIEPVIISDACGSCRGKTFHDMGIKLAKRQIGEDQVITFDELKDKLEHKTVEILI